VLIYRIVNMSGSYNAAVAAAAFATILACSMSARLVSSHLRNWAKPVEQMLTIVIIAMVPLFAVDSFIGLLEVKATVCTQLLNDSVVVARLKSVVTLRATPVCLRQT
jgi:Mn2+/Fe2+ NRAMP family transporter